MTAEQQVFLSLLRDYFSGTAATVLPEAADGAELARLAREQSMSGVIYVQLKAMGAPAEWMEQLRPGFYSDVFYAANREADVAEVLQRAGDLPCLAFKGWAVKETWPEPALRTMGDVDLLIRAEDRQAWDRVMLELGYEKFVDNHAVWNYTRRGVSFELHVSMFYEELTGLADYRGFFDRAWEWAGPPLDPTFHLLFLLSHLAKHVVNRGMGFRGFLDLAFFCRANAAALDLPRLRQGLEELKLTVFAGNCAALCREWFGAELPVESTALREDFLREETGKLFRDGTFGLENRENDAGTAARDIRRQGSYAAGAAVMIWRRLFPPYRDMQLVPWYSFVDGRPWLMPAAWVYRWMYCLANKREHSFALLARPVADKPQIDARTQQLKEWGL